MTEGPIPETPGEQGPAEPPPSRAGALALGWQKDTPVTYSLAALILVAFLGELAWVVAHSGSVTTGTEDGNALYALGALYPRSGEGWRMVTSVFLHAGWVHLLLNTYSLLVLGVMTERALGHLRTLLAFLAAGLAGALTSSILAPGALAVGASAAVFGLAGMLIGRVYLGRPRVPAPVRGMLQGLVVIVVINLAAGFLITQIDNAAHFGGLGAGLLLGAIIPSTDSKPVRYLLFSVTAALVVVYVVGIVMGLTHLGELPPG